MTRHTTPPAVLPLLPICALALIVGDHALALAHLLLALVGILDFGDRGPGWAAVAGVAAVDLPVFVLACVALRWTVRRWVVRHPPA